jgi:hypothetical protein
MAYSASSLGEKAESIVSRGLKKGLSEDSLRIAGEGAGDCDQGDAKACSYSS